MKINFKDQKLEINYYGCNKFKSKFKFKTEEVYLLNNQPVNVVFLKENEKRDHKKHLEIFKEQVKFIIKNIHEQGYNKKQEYPNFYIGSRILKSLVIKNKGFFVEVINQVQLSKKEGKN